MDIGLEINWFRNRLKELGDEKRADLQMFDEGVHWLKEESGKLPEKFRRLLI